MMDLDDITMAQIAERFAKGSGPCRSLITGQVTYPDGFEPMRYSPLAHKAKRCECGRFNLDSAGFLDHICPARRAAAAA